MITVEELERRIEKRYGDRMLKDIKSPKRQQLFVALRVIYYYICIENGISEKDAMVILNKNRTSLYHFKNKFENEYKYNAYFKGIADELLKE